MNVDEVARRVIGQEGVPTAMRMLYDDDLQLNPAGVIRKAIKTAVAKLDANDKKRIGANASKGRDFRSALRALYGDRETYTVVMMANAGVLCYMIQHH